MSQVDLAGLRIDADAAKPRRPLGPRLLGAAVLLLLAATAATFLWPLLRPARAVPTAAIRAADAATAAGAGVAAAEAVGWVEPDPFPVAIRPLVAGRIATIEVLEGHEVVAGETLIATMESAELLAAYERSHAAWAAALAARTVAEEKLATAEARRAQLAEQRRTVLAAELALADKRTKLTTARGAAARSAAEAKGAAAALQAQERLTAEGSGHAVALARARAEAEAADAAAATAAAEVTALEAEEAAARAQLELERELLAQPVDLDTAVKVARAESVMADKAAAVAEAEHEIATRELDLAREVRAPVSGTVLRLLASPGETTGPDDAGIVALYDPNRLQARIDVPLDAVGAVAAGQRVELTSEITGRAVVRGVVQRVQRETDLLKNTLQVKVTLTDPPAIWRPETLVRARFFDDENAAPQDRSAREPTFLVPKTAVRGGSVFVFDAARGRARAVPVTVVGEDGEHAVVRGDLSVAQRVILVEVADGATVEEEER